MTTAPAVSAGSEARRRNAAADRMPSGFFRLIAAEAEVIADGARAMLAPALNEQIDRARDHEFVTLQGMQRMFSCAREVTG